MQRVAVIAVFVSVLMGMTAAGVYAASEALRRPGAGASMGQIQGRVIGQSPFAAASDVPMPQISRSDLGGALPGGPGEPAFVNRLVDGIVNATTASPEGGSANSGNGSVALAAGPGQSGSGHDNPAVREPDYDLFDVRTHHRPAPKPVEGQGVTPVPPAPKRQSVYQLGDTITGPAAGSPEDIAREFLQGQITQGHISLFGQPSVNQPTLKLENEFQTGDTGLTHLVFRKTYNGVPVFGGQTQAHVLNDGSILRADVPEPSLSPQAAPTASISADYAIKFAADAVSPDSKFKLEQTTGPFDSDRKTVFNAQPFSREIAVSLVYFPMADKTELAWKVLIAPSQEKMYLVVVSAEYARILFSRNLTIEEKPKGTVFKAPRTSSSGDTGIVNPDGGSETLEPFTGWPASTGDCAQPGYTGGTGCWVSTTSTNGNNVMAMRETQPNDFFPSNTTAAAPLAHFNFPFTNAYEATGDFGADGEAAATNLFYWNNVIHDWLYDLGFTETAGNFQSSNFGRGGLEFDNVLAFSQVTFGTNNAFISVPEDGFSPEMNMFLFTDPPFRRVDAAFDPDIIIHEYVHGLTIRMVGGPSNVFSLPGWQSGAMGEGWGDAYAVSLTDDPIAGEYSTGDAKKGIRGVAYDNNNHTFGRNATLLNLGVSGGNVMGHPEVHADGEIWATVLYDLRRDMITADPVNGRHDFEQVITSALALTPSRPSMLDARDAIIQAAFALSLGGANQCQTWQVFAARGFGFSAALNHVNQFSPNDTALSVFEAFDVPTACGGTPPGSGSTVYFDDMEGGINGWTSDGLWNQSTRRDGGGTGTPFAWYYGDDVLGNYDTGATTFGSLISPNIVLTREQASNSVVLEWDQYMATEGSLGPVTSFDSGWVQVSTNDGASWKNVSMLSHDSDGSAFDHHKVDLSRLGGKTQIKIRFYFDSLDGIANNFEGWYIDNVRLSAGPDLDTNGGPLVAGIPVTTSVDSVVDRDGWTFTGTPGDFANIVATPVTGSAVRPELHIFSPNGQHWDDRGRRTPGSKASVILQITEAGTYDVISKGYKNRSSGGHDISLSFSTITDTGGGAMSAGATGSTVSAGIDFTGDTDDWTFSGNAGQFVKIQLRSTTPGLNPFVELIDPFAAVEISDDDSGEGGKNALIIWQLKLSGTYTIRASAEDKGYSDPIISGSTGGYDLTLSLPAIADTGGGPITPGTPVSATIDSTKDGDTWTFSATPGQLIRARLDATAAVTGAGTNLDPFLKLIAPSTSVESENDNSGLGNNSLIERPLNESGQYKLKVSGSTNVPGGYSLSLESVVDTGGGSIAIGTTALGGIDVPGDVDTWTFNGSGGQRVVTAIYKDGQSLLTPLADIFSPSSGFVGSLFGTVFPTEITLPVTGAYTVNVSNQISAAGDYKLALVEDIGGGAIVPGTPVSGTVDLAFELDRWTFTSDGLKTVTISLVADAAKNNDLEDPFVCLEGPNFTSLGCDDDGAGGLDSLLVLPLSEPGTYTILAEGFSSSIGDYTLTLTLDPLVIPVTANALANDDFETGTLTGWTTLSVGGCNPGVAINDGTFIPDSPDGALPPFQGLYSAITFQCGPSKNTILQDVSIDPNRTFPTLSFTDRVRNHAGTFQDGAFPQEYRVQVRDTNNVLLEELFSTAPGDVALTDWTTRNFDLSAYIGQTIRISFEQEDNLFFFNVHLDDASLSSQLGDANVDGATNIFDITTVELIILAIIPPTPSADATGDSLVNALDITKVELVILGVVVAGQPAPAAAPVLVSIDAPSQVAPPPESSFIASVNVDQITGFDAGNFDVTFDDSVLTLDSVGSGSIGGIPIPIEGIQELSPGTWRVVVNVAGTPGVSGSGSLAELNFSVIGADGTSSNIGLENVVLGDNIAVQLESTVLGATVNVATGAPPETPLAVSIDIMPKKDVNRIKPKDLDKKGKDKKEKEKDKKNKGKKIPVALLGSDTFDVNDVDVTTLVFGPNEASPIDLEDSTKPKKIEDHLKDVNHDGFVDLKLKFQLRETGIANGDTEACLKGKTKGGVAFEGCDAIETPGGDSSVPTHLIVLKGDVDVEATAQELAQDHRLEVTDKYTHALKGIAALVPESELEALRMDPRVIFVEDNEVFEVFPQGLPSGVDRVDADRNTLSGIDGVDNRVDADIAIIDTGIDLNHPDLNVHQWTNCARRGPSNTRCKNGDSGANDGNGHGTHVAGIAGALDNDSGVVGVAPGARLWAVKVLDDSGSGWMNWVIAGIDYVTKHANELETANMSLGCECTSAALDEAIAKSVAAGVVYTVAAGNSGVDAAAFTPANHPDVITVSAIADYDGAGGGAYADIDCYGFNPPFFGPDDTFANFSNFGSVVDIAAPGVCILSTWTGGGFNSISGTSMASPHVAGAAALVKVANPSFTADEVLEALLGSAIPQGDTNGFTGDPDTFPEPLLNIASGAPATLTSIEVTPGAASIEEGQTQQFTATGAYSDGGTADLTTTASWVSSETPVASIDSSGLATGVAAGTVSVTASQDGIGSNVGTLTVTVPAPPATLTSIEVSPGSATVVEGQTQQFTATGTYSDGNTADLTAAATWVSSETTVASIDGSGLATGAGQGSTNITASLDGITSDPAAVLTGTTGTATDAVAITKANYNHKKQKLDVRATSSAGGDVTLTATAFDSEGAVLGSVVLEYKAKKDQFEGAIDDLKSKPFRLEVVSTRGGSASFEGNQVAGKSEDNEDNEDNEDDNKGKDNPKDSG